MKQSFLMLFVVSSIAFSAADDEPLKKAVTAGGVLSIRGKFDPNEYGIAMQSWSQEVYATSGAIAVAVEGTGVPARVADSIAARFPGALQRTFSPPILSSAVRVALRHIIDQLNAECASVSPVIPIGAHVKSVAVLIACGRVGKYEGVYGGTATHSLAEAALIPQPAMKWINDPRVKRAVEVKLPTESADEAPAIVLRREPRAAAAAIDGRAESSSFHASYAAGVERVAKECESDNCSIFEGLLPFGDPRG